MEPNVDPKMWWASKTIWVNAIAAVAMLIQLKTGYAISPEMQVALLMLVNILLRQITHQPVVWTAKQFARYKNQPSA